MNAKKDFLKRVVFSRLDIAAIACAIILSTACLIKGAVNDAVVALISLLSIPVLFMAYSSTRSVHPTLKTLGITLLSGLAIILVLQQLMPSTALQDTSAWLQGIGRLLFFILIFVTALYIGTSEYSSRLFLQALLVSGCFFMTLTFFIATDDGVPLTTFYSYTHGFVNPNNAAAYIGVMLLLALAQSVRLFNLPARTFRKIFLHLVDQLTMSVILKGGFLLYALLLTLAGLFMTGSRGGILITFVSAALFALLIILKVNLQSRVRKAIIVIAMMMIGAILVWSFTNFGQITMNKLETQGISTNSRFDIFAAVLPMIKDHPLLGVGLGGFPAAFQHYRPESVSADGIIDKAHNSYLEFAAEMGVPALLLLLGVLGYMGNLLYRGIKDRQERYVVPTLGLTIWAFAALYSLVDFPLQIPGIAALMIAIVTVCASQTERRFSEPAQTSTAPRKRVRTRKRRSPKGAA